jgi:hypothetical protein
MPPRTARFGNQDRFHLSDKIELHRAAGFQRIVGRIIVHRERRKWQHNVAFSGSIPLQPALPICPHLISNAEYGSQPKEDGGLLRPSGACRDFVFFALGNLCTSSASAS